MLTNLRVVMLVGLGPLCLAGCSQQMADQPSYRPLRPSAFFADGRSERPLIAGTVARGQLNDDVHLHTGKWPRQIQDVLQAGGVLGTAAGNPLSALAMAFERPLYADTFPMPITRSGLEHGQERFNIYCAVCHDQAGTGRGMVVQRGFTPPPSFHTDWSRGLALQGSRVKLRDAPVGYYFTVITRGYGAMPDYAEQVPVADRWAIIAYIRALQLSQGAALADVRDEREKQKLLRGLP
jgi:mono/diheme cytochrome c family protein